MGNEITESGMRFPACSMCDDENKGKNGAGRPAGVLGVFKTTAGVSKGTLNPYIELR